MYLSINEDAPKSGASLSFEIENSIEVEFTLVQFA
jgi:hypothetical protein